MSKSRNSKLDRFADKAFSWKKIKANANARFVRTAYGWVFAVPIAAKFLSLINQETASLTIFGHSFEVLLALPFSWSMFFFAALLFMIGHGIYIFKGPTIIQEHANWAEFEAAGKTYLHLDQYSYDDPTESEMMEVGFNSVGKPPTEADTKKRYWEMEGRANFKYPNFRWAAGLAINTGWVLIALVVIQNSFTVCKLIINA